MNAADVRAREHARVVIHPRVLQQPWTSQAAFAFLVALQQSPGLSCSFPRIAMHRERCTTADDSPRPFDRFATHRSNVRRTDEVIGIKVARGRAHPLEVSSPVHCRQRRGASPVRGAGSAHVAVGKVCAPRVIRVVHRRDVLRPGRCFTRVRSSCRKVSTTGSSITLCCARMVSLPLLALTTPKREPSASTS